MELFAKFLMWLSPMIVVYVQSVPKYAEYYLENDKLCALDSRSSRYIELGDTGWSGAIVDQTTYFNTLSGTYSFDCQFRVNAKERDMGLFAVIQKLSLRKKNNGECLDYLQFRTSNNLAYFGPFSVVMENHDYPWGHKYCGIIKANEFDMNKIALNDNSQILPHAYVERKGQIDVHIHIANETVSKGSLDLKIAFTAFHLCRPDRDKNYKKCGADACIWHEFFDDGILNCPFTSCLDEHGCHITIDDGGKGNGFAAKLLVGAAAGLFTMFIVSIAFLWLFRHCVLCWSTTAECAQNDTQMSPVPTVEDIPNPPSSRSLSVNKDLPPSYESLFPSA